MAVAADEDPPPKRKATEQELAEFSDWALEFLDFLSAIPTAEEDQ